MMSSRPSNQMFTRLAEKELLKPPHGAKQSLSFGGGRG
jgi:hypothetical protein